MRIRILMLLMLGMTSAGNGDELSGVSLSTEVHQALSRNAALFSGVLIKGERYQQFLVPGATALETLQTTESEADFTNRLRFELRFSGPMFRESIEYPSGDAYTRDAVYETSFDGTNFILGYKRLDDLASSNVQIYTPAIAAEYGKQHDKPDLLAKMEFWYLREAGFSGPQTILRLGHPVESTVSDAANHGQIVSVNEVTGKSGKLLEVVIEQPEPWQSAETYDIDTYEPFRILTNGTDVLQKRMERERRQLFGKSRLIRYWLNAALGYAVEEKWELRKETGEVMFHTQNSDFVQVTSENIWMPKRCLVTSHAYFTAPVFVSSDPVYETVILVEDFQPGRPAEDEFRIWYDSPGVLVSDWTSPKATPESSDDYQVAAPLTDLPKRTSWTKRLLVLSNVLLLSGGLAWLCVRLRNKKRES